MIRQLAFDLPHQEAFSREDFFVSPANAIALATVDTWQTWPLGKLLLIGPAGSGKSHIAHIWAQETGGTIISARRLAQADLPDLAASPYVAVEDAHEVAGMRAAETALFHLHNMVVPQGRLLITAQTPARDWGIVLPDLRSRMDAAHVARIGAPDDALLSAVLIKLFADRQISVSPTLIPYIVGRMERTISAARRLVNRLDSLSLALGKPVTRALTASLLDSLEDE